MGRSGNPARRWVSTGINIQVKDKYQADPVDPGPGKHLWTVVTMFSVNPSSGEFTLDHENLVTIVGPGCYKCEEGFTPELGAAPCLGSMR